MIRPTPEKAQDDVQQEWDLIARLRHDQIVSGADLSIRQVLVPCLLDLINSCDRSNVVDIGCGSGTLSAELKRGASNVVGVDSSLESIQLAVQTYGQTRGLTFVPSTVERYAAAHASEFTLAIANMVLMTTRDLETLVAAVATLLVPGGVFAFTLTHPCFWPRYWGYDAADWFDYTKVIVIEAPFKISRVGPSSFITTHVHRPIGRYVEALTGAGFLVESLVEPMPSPAVQAQYPQPWTFPRFLGGRAVLAKPL